MKLSEAIRLGSMLKPQIYGGVRSVRPIGILGLREEITGTCALGAAYMAAGCRTLPCDPSTGSQSRLGGGPATTAIHVPQEWAYMFLTVACPVASPCPVMATGQMHQIVAHLNDAHRWTREAIADWVEALEQERAADDGDAEPAPVHELNEK